MQVLGLDVGNGKVKCCWIDWQGSWEQSVIRWESLPLPLSANRRQDFEMGLPVQILNFLDQHRLGLDRIEKVVACCSQSFSYQPYSESITHLAQVLGRVFPAARLAMVRVDGELTPVAEIAGLETEQLYAYTFTNYYGSALLGSRLIQRGLSLDLGTTTLDVIPIQGGRIDPEGLARPADYLRFRYSQGRIHWLGLTTVPLCMLADRVPVGALRYQVVPRNYASDLLFGFESGDQSLLRRHAYGNQFPSAETSRQRLAQFVGLDDSLMTLAEISEVRAFLYQQLVERVAGEIAAVARQTFTEPLHSLEIASFALGEELLLKPALERAGFDSQNVKTLALGREQGLWSASSVFAMALLALEAGLGQQVEIN